MRSRHRKSLAGAQEHLAFAFRGNGGLDIPFPSRKSSFLGQVRAAQSSSLLSCCARHGLFATIRGTQDHRDGHTCDSLASVRYTRVAVVVALLDIIMLARRPVFANSNKTNADRLSTSRVQSLQINQKKRNPCDSK